MAAKRLRKVLSDDFIMEIGALRHGGSSVSLVVGGVKWRLRERGSKVA